MNLLRALATVSSMTLVSRVLGFVRDFVVARTFGAGLATDAFFVAFKLPNLLRRLFAEGAFSQAFVPILAEYKNRRGEADARTLVDRVTSVLALVLLAVTALGVAGAPLLVYVSAPGFAADTEKFELTVSLTRITFPYIFFMSLVAMAGGILNTWSRFAIPAFTPVLLNLSFIGMAIFAAPHFAEPAMALGWAVFLGGILQLGLQVPALLKIGMLPRLCNVRVAWADEGVRRVLYLMAPAVLGVSVSQLSLLINTIFASFLKTGSVSWLYYADRLMEFPAGMLGAALGTILLPSLAKLHASGQQEDYSSLLDWGLRLTLMLALPASLGLAIAGLPLIATLFHYGAFTAGDVTQTRSALLGYSLGLTGLILIKVLAPGFYARQNIRTPVKIALVSLAITQMLNMVFIGPFGHAGLALSISVAALINAGLLYRGLRLQGVYQPLAGWGKFLFKLLIAMLAMGAFLFWAVGDESRWLAFGLAARAGRVTALVIGAGAIYFATLYVLGFRPADFRRRAA